MKIIDEIKSRKDAMRDGDGQYFTGKPCKYGHVATRYTQSGTCSQCVLDAAADTRKHLNGDGYQARARATEQRAAKLEEMLKLERAKKAAVRELHPVKLYIMPQCISTVFDVAASLCIAKYPILDIDDVYAQNKQTPPGSGAYRVPVPRDDMTRIRKMAERLYIDHCGIDIERDRARILRLVLKQADDESSAPPEVWK